MSYRSVVHSFIAASRKTRKFVVELENGEKGLIAASDASDAMHEASRWAKGHKSHVKRSPSRKRSPTIGDHGKTDE